VCILPCLGRKPLGDPDLETPRLADEPIDLERTSRKRLKVRAGEFSLAVVRCGRLRVCIEDD
jgi:hypothetical protein